MGPQGQMGPQGATGPAGTPQLTIAQSSGVVSAPFGSVDDSVQVLCPATLEAIGGGYENPDLGGGILVDAAYPLAGGIGWYFEAHSTDKLAHVLDVYAVCTTAAS
jgi:hypothetical protein